MKRFPPALWILFFGRVVTAGGFSFSFPFFTVYAANHLHIPASHIGLALLASGAMGAVSKYLGGEWSDRWGRKPVMLLALGGRAVTSAGLAFVILSGHGFLPLAALFLASNFFGQLFEPSSQAFVADITTGRVRVESFGLVRLGINGGWAAGLLVHGFVAGAHGTTFAITACVFTFSFILVSLAIREPRHTRSAPVPLDLRAVAANRPFTALCLATLLIMVVGSQLVPSTSIYVTAHAGVAESHLPYILAVNGALVCLLQFPASRWMAQAGLLRSLVLGSLTYAAGYASFALGTTAPHFACSIALVTLGEVLVMPAGVSLASQLAPDAQRGRYLGIYGLSTNAGWSLGPAFGGVLLDARPGRSGLLWFTLAGIASLAALGYAAMGRRWKLLPVEEPAPPVGEPVGVKP